MRIEFEKCHLTATCQFVDNIITFTKELRNIVATLKRMILKKRHSLLAVFIGFAILLRDGSGCTASLTAAKGSGDSCSSCKVQ